MRHRLPVVVSAAVCAVVAGYRSYTAIAEWVDDVPATTALTLDVMAACDQDAGVVLASIDVDGKTNESPCAGHTAMV